MNTNVYIDGFNFYYGCVKNNAFKWLDFDAFCRASLPNDTINAIRYFTADVVTDSSNPDAQVRQATYLRALGTIAHLSIHKGRFFTSRKKGKLFDPQIPGVSLVTILAREEKGTDVSIATHLVADAFRGDFEKAVIVSNDSDLVGPIDLIRQELHLTVDVLSPHNVNGKPSYHLQQVASSYSTVDRTLLPNCQFPNSLLDANGRTITKPTAW